VQTAKTHPVFGTGPGTFSIPYKHLKAPEAEMAKLAHNDYLEQATDSGMVGFLAFSGFTWGSMALLYRGCQRNGWFLLLIWIGLLGWCLQAFIEFGLYIPALAWPVFLLFGVLWAVPTQEQV
jgi:O-antigen ligase